jgi:uncharacterized cupredoxin-like copper-binding protein
MINQLVMISAGLALLVPSAFGHDNERHEASYGKPGDPAKISRTVEVDMSDTMRYSPATIQVKKGETIRLLARNSGQVKHEIVLGTIMELRKHAALMKKYPEMEHADANHLTVEPGKSGVMVWQFTRTGVVDFACLQPGHYEAGMRGKFAVK